MIVDWRGLLSSIGIAWIDRGANHTAGNVNIKCPFCMDDPSYHLGISLNREAYYCYRNPNQHSGRSFTRLLLRLDQDRDSAIRLLNYYNTGRKAVQAGTRTPTPLEPIKRAWDRFKPAQHSNRCLDYLTSRGFANAGLLCERYDLRYAPEGSWTRRLLIPLHKDGEVISWTGRDLSGRAELRYRMQTVDGHFPVFAPDEKKPKRDVLVVVEGPMDALRLAAATRSQPIITVALCGLHLASGKMNELRRIGAGCEKVLVALDSEVPFSTVYQAVDQIGTALKARYVGRAKLPPGVKDPGELPVEGILPWLNESLSLLNNNDRRLY